MNAKKGHASACLAAATIVFIVVIFGGVFILLVRHADAGICWGGAGNACGSCTCNCGSVPDDELCGPCSGCCTPPALPACFGEACTGKSSCCDVGSPLCNIGPSTKDCFCNCIPINNLSPYGQVCVGPDSPYPHANTNSTCAGSLRFFKSGSANCWSQCENTYGPYSYTIGCDDYGNCDPIPGSLGDPEESVGSNGVIDNWMSACNDDNDSCTVGKWNICNFDGSFTCQSPEPEEYGMLQINLDSLSSNTGWQKPGSLTVTPSPMSTCTIQSSYYSCQVDAGGPPYSAKNVSTLYSPGTYFGMSPVNPNGTPYTTPGSFTCAWNASDVNLGWQNLFFVHYHTGTVETLITTAGSWPQVKIMQAANSYTYPTTGYATAFNGSGFYGIPAPNPTNTVTIEVLAPAGYMVCAQAGSVVPTVADCTVGSAWMNANPTKVGGSDGVLARVDGILSHQIDPAAHFMLEFGIRVVAAPVPAWQPGQGVQPSTDQKLYDNATPIGFRIENATPNSLVRILAQKTRGPLGFEGNPNDTTYDYDIGEWYVFPATQLVKINGDFDPPGNTLPGAFGDIGTVVGANAIGRWQFKVRVNNGGGGTLEETPTWEPNNGVKVFAGTFTIQPQVDNGASMGFENVGVGIPFAWVYPSVDGSSQEAPCASSPCTIAATTLFTQDPLVQSGAAPLDPHYVRIDEPDGTVPIVQYPNADILGSGGWKSGCGADLISTPIEAIQSIPAPGCSGAARGDMIFRPQIINTQIRVRARVCQGTSCTCPGPGCSISGSLLGSTNGTVSGDNAGSVTFPVGGQYTINGLETRTGNAAEGLHWGVRYQ